MKTASLVLASLLPLTGCGDFPRDAKDTLKQVEAGRPLRVGWSTAEPWVKRGPNGEPAGLEPDLIRAWAAEHGMRVRWIEAGEAQLVEALGENTLDAAVAGFAKSAPWGARIGQTQPYLSPKLVIGARPGAGAPGDWDGVPVSYDPRRPQVAALIKAEGAVPVTGDAPFRAVYEPELGALGLISTGTTLITEQRTIAVPASENALALSLDRFLHARKGAIERRLAEEARR